MNSVMNFLADYYIWFFVAALLLSFALIGFIIDTKKKQKNEFKGESIETNNTLTNEEATAVQNDTTTLESINPTPVSDETMEINDIPFNENQDVNKVEEPITIGEQITMDKPVIEELNIPEAPEYKIAENEEMELESLDFEDNNENKNA